MARLPTLRTRRSRNLKPWARRFWLLAGFLLGVCLALASLLMAAG